MDSILRGPTNGNECYFTRDMLTDPPTIIQIVPNASYFQHSGDNSGRPPQHVSITFADIEPTEGWLSDRNNASLDICFMHSFGKCSGKARERNPRTCHQIHVKREVLDSLRKMYINPQRHYFCRTMKANITPQFSQVLSLFARRNFSLQYLEFRTDDIDVTAGSTSYEVQYRNWLVCDTELARESKSNAPTQNFISTSNICWDYAITGKCPRGSACQDIHGHIAKALIKDRFVRMALEEMSKRDPQPDTAKYCAKKKLETAQMVPTASQSGQMNLFCPNDSSISLSCNGSMYPAPAAPPNPTPFFNSPDSSNCGAFQSEPRFNPPPYATFPQATLSSRQNPVFFLSESSPNVFQVVQFAYSPVNQ